MRLLLNDKKVLILSVFVAGLCSLVYELLISTTAAYFLGDSVKQFSVTIGLYLAAMGLGSYVSRLFKTHLLRSFIAVEWLLGIVGGLSVLGTTGVVIPYSCSSWIHSIHRGIDVARAAGLAHVAAATGSTSEQAVQRLYGLPDMALLDMGDFAGGLLKYLRDHPLPRLTIAGGFAKLAKLAQGHLDLHSGKSRVDTGFLAEVLGELGAAPEVVDRARACETGAQVLAVARDYDLPLADVVAARAAAVAQETAGDQVKVEVLIFDRDGSKLGSSEAVPLGA